MFKKLMQRLEGHKTKLGNSLVLLSMQMPPGKAQTYTFAIGSVLSGVGIADVMMKILFGKKEDNNV